VTTPTPLDPAALRFDPPCVPLTVVSDVLAEHYGLDGTLQPLEGERDQNTMVTTDDGRRYVLKIASPSEDPEVADLQCAALRHVAATDPGVGVPHVVPSVDGSDIVTTTIDGVPAPTRLLTYLDGIPFHDVVLSEAELHRVGAAQGRLAHALKGFEHPAATSFMAWSLDSGMIHHPQLWENLSADGHTAADPYRDRVEHAAAATSALRRGVLHNDGHRGNLLRTDDTSSSVSGVIDFGDIAETCVVADLAICVASFVDGHSEQRGAAAAVAAGYDRWMALTDGEIELLADLVLTRIVLGSLLVEFQAGHAPPERLPEIAGELPTYRANMAAWGSLDPAQTTDAVHQAISAARRSRDSSVDSDQS
jgi:Ser/Thr protein kinase RdoA (MazF antagonist)